MFKRVLMAVAVAAAVSAPAFAEVSISGSAEMDLFYRTNQTADGNGKVWEEVAIVINIDGKDKLDSGDTLKWRVAQKVATDYRYDSFGGREAWIGYQGGWGELRFGTQFTNSYLMLYWPYGVKGTGNLWADFGAHTDKWKDAVSYFSPNWGGFSFAAQYKLGSQDDASNTNGLDLTASFGTDMFNIDAGYQGNYDQLVAAHSVGASGTSVSDAVVNGASTEVYHVGTRVRFGDFALRAGYKYNQWDLGTVGNSDVNFSQYLVGGTFGFGKNAISLSYQLKDEVEVRGVDYDNEIQQVAFQWDYALSKNTGAFLQARHQWFDEKKVALPGWALDGWNGKESSVSRVLVGTWTGF